MNARTTKLTLATLMIGLASASLAEAGHDRRASDPLLAVAFDVEEGSRYLHYKAERTAHHGTRGERRALALLHELEDGARDFRLTLQRFGPYSRRTENAWAELSWAWEDARRTFPALHGFSPVRKEFRRVDYLMDDLSQRYETTLAYQRPGRRGVGGHGSAGYVLIGAHGDRGHASFGLRWDDEYDD